MSIDFQNILDLYARSVLAQESIAQSLVSLQPKLSSQPQWERIYTEDWFRYPLNTEVPQDTTWTPDWNPWTAGTEADYASVQIVASESGKHAAQCRLINPFGGDNGARLFHNLYNQWLFWGQFENRTLRIRAKATYEELFQIEQGDGMYCQTFMEFKTLDSKRTAIQILLEDDGNEHLVHWGVIGDRDIHPAIKTPVIFGVPLDYELIVTFSRDPLKGYMKFTYDQTVLEGYGRTLNLNRGFAGGALLLYSNAIKGNASVKYEDYTIDRLVG